MQTFSILGACRASFAAVLVCAALPTVASAAITQATVTDPASPFVAIDDQSGAPAAVVVSGTTDSTAPGVDTVNLRCTSAGAVSSVLVSGVALNLDGTFSASVSLFSLSNAGPCVIRAFPAGTSNLSWPRFRGPTALVSRWSTTPITGGPNNGALSTFRYNQVQRRGVVTLAAAGEAGVTDATAVAPSGELAASPAQAEFGLLSRREFGNAPQASILVDGLSGYTTYAAVVRVGDQAPGLPALTATPSLTATGALLVEASDVVRCDDEAACTAFVPTGVRFERTYTLGADGRRQRVSDSFVSTDGLAHALDVAYAMDGTAAIDYGFAITGGTIFERLSETTLTFGGGPISMIGRETDDQSGEGGLSYGLGLTWLSPPELRFAGPEGNDFEALYVREIPAGGAVGLDMAMTVGWGMESIRDLVLEHENELVDPSVEITSPAADTATSNDRVFVTGSTGGPRALGVLSQRVVTINGVIAALTPAGAWSADVPLVVGSNTLTVVATNSAGRTATTTSTVTRSALVGPPAPVTTTITTTNTIVAAAATAVAARGLSAKVVGNAKRLRKTISYTLWGQLQRPAGVPAVTACQGWVRLTMTRTGAPTRVAWTPLRSNCTYQRTLTFPRGSKGSIALTSRFTGTQFLRPISAARVNLPLR